MDSYIKGFHFIQDIVGLRWVPEIIFAIESGHTHFTSILESIDYLSDTELQRKLKTMVENNVVEKLTEEARPEYRLLPLGEELAHILYHFNDLGEKYFQKL